METKTKASDCTFNARNVIALVITGIAAFVTITVTIISLFPAEGKADLDFISKTLLPLIATWLGAILAYYFAKSQYDAANTQQEKIIDKLTLEKRLDSLKASEKMILFSDMVKLELDDYLNTSILRDILQNKKMSNHNRFLFFNKEKIRFIIHRSILDRFITESLVNLSPDEVKNLKLIDLINDDNPAIKKYVHGGIEYLPAYSTLFEAKQLIDASTSCDDIIITLTGRKDEDVLGWIPDSLLAKYVKV